MRRLLYWIGKLTGTIIIFPHPIAVGNCGEEIYFGLLKARMENKKLVIIFPYELPWLLRLGIPNREMIEVESPYRAFLPTHPLYPICCWIVTLYFGFFRGVSIVTDRYFKVRLSEALTIPMHGQELLWMPKPSMPSFSWDVVNAYHWESEIKRFLEISLSASKQAFALQQRRALGLPDDAWFVCLHVREGGYYNDHETVERNADINNYIPAIQEITRRGGWVVRMGDRSMKKLPQMERVIDYPFTPQKSELMDVYFLKECHTYMGMQSGILDVAFMFQRPIIMTNMYSWFLGYPQLEQDIGIFRHVYSKPLKRFLTPMEWPLLPWSKQTFDPKEDYEFYENSPEELLAVVKEYFDRGSDWTPAEKQMAFDQLRQAKAREVLSKPLTQETTQDDIAGRYRLATRLLGARGMLSENFLSSYSVRQEELLSKIREKASAPNSVE